MNKLISSFLYTAVLLILSAPVKSQVIWYGDPNKDLRNVFYRFDITGYTSGDYCVDNVTADPTASTPTDSVYGKHWEINKPANRKRAEFARTNGFIPQEDGEYYFGWRWKITSSPTLNKGIAVFQCKTEAGTNNPSTQNYPFTLEYDGTNLALACFGPGYPDWTEGSSITNRKTTIWRQAVSQDQWVTFAFHVKFSRNGELGFIEFWYNGEQQTLTNLNYKEYQVVLSEDKKRAYHKTNDGNQVYFKWGAYGKNACEFNITTKYDEMRVANSYEELAVGDQRISKSAWTLLSADSEAEGNPASYAFDGNNNTFWHTPWGNAETTYPHEIAINLGALYQLTGFSYLPRQDNSVNGTIDEYRISVSTDATNWQKVTEGTWEGSKYGKWVVLDSVDAQYVKLTALSELNNNAFASAAEIGLYGEKVIATGATHLPLKNSGTKILVYPNPAKHSFYVVLKEMKNAVISVYNSHGSRICELKTTESLVEFKTDSLFKRGLYFIKIKDENDNYYTRKLIIV